MLIITTKAIIKANAILDEDINEIGIKQDEEARKNVKNWLYVFQLFMMRD